MNSAHLHLALNHLPVIGLLFALGVFVVGRLIRSDVTMRVGLWLFVASAVFCGHFSADCVSVAARFISRRSRAAR